MEILLSFLVWSDSFITPLPSSWMIFLSLLFPSPFSQRTFNFSHLARAKYFFDFHFLHFSPLAICRPRAWQYLPLLELPSFRVSLTIVPLSPPRAPPMFGSIYFFSNLRQIFRYYKSQPPRFFSGPEPFSPFKTRKMFFFSEFRICQSILCIASLLFKVFFSRVSMGSP